MERGSNSYLSRITESAFIKMNNSKLKQALQSLEVQKFILFNFCITDKEYIHTA